MYENLNPRKYNVVDDDTYVIYIRVQTDVFVTHNNRCACCLDLQLVPL